MDPQDGTVDEVLGRIASRQHGLATRGQLLLAGVSDQEIKGRLRKKALIRVHRGVYRVGHRAPSVEARYLAAVLACGEGTLLSGSAAAHVWGLLKGAAPPPEVTAPTKRRIPGVRTKRGRRGEARDATTHRGIPVTTVPRTLLDLASLLSFEALARACHEAGVKYRTTPRHVEVVLARRPSSPGAGQLRRILEGDAHVTLSALERRFLEVLREAGLPLPRMNRPAGGRRVDCRWPEHKLTVELDSYRYHSSRHAWELDHRRAREAHAREDEFRRYTHGDVFDAPRQMLTELAGLLGG
jgi:Transcriptional regulator, AbiEi antitoxin